MLYHFLVVMIVIAVLAIACGARKTRSSGP